MASPEYLRAKESAKHRHRDSSVPRPPISAEGNDETPDRAIASRVLAHEQRKRRLEQEGGETLAAINADPTWQNAPVPTRQRTTRRPRTRRGEDFGTSQRMTTTPARQHHQGVRAPLAKESALDVAKREFDKILMPPPTMSATQMRAQEEKEARARIWAAKERNLQKRLQRKVEKEVLRKREIERRILRARAKAREGGIRCLEDRFRYLED